MEIYLVRLSSNKELGGIFAAPTADRLWEYVDECCDVESCEFTELGAGGLYLSDAGAPRVPTIKRYPTDEKDIPDWFAGTTLSELWMDVFYCDDAEWRPIGPEE